MAPSTPDPAANPVLLAALADATRENARLASKLERHQRLLQQLLRIQHRISSSAPLHSILDEIVAGATALIGDEAGNIRLQDPLDPTRLVLAGRVSDPAAAIARVDAIHVGDGATGRAFVEERLVVIEDYGNARGTNPAYHGSRLTACMAAPVRQNGGVIGVIVVATQRPGRTYSAEEREMLLAFAEHASLALTAAQRLSAVEHLAFHDCLTGLVNRAHFMEKLDQSLARAQGTRSRIGVLFIDLDDFKMVNDSLGHAVGDKVLEVIGRRLVDAVRTHDVAGRLGGDEFAVLLEDAGNDEDVRHVVERLQSLLNQPMSIDEHTVSVTASVGTAMSDGSHDAAEVLRNADLAMYVAKTRKDGCVAAYEASTHSEAVARRRLEAELRRALADGQLEVHYQPIVRLDCARTSGVEALLRWRHPSRGLVMPLDFIPLAEATELIVPMGAWVLREATAQAAAWRGLPGCGDLVVSVNLSARQLLRAEIVDEVRQALTCSGLAPGALVLEITESAILEDGRSVRNRARALKKLGVRLALDDFGTGYSSLARLQQLPVDVVKVDRRFVKDLGTGRDGAAVAAAIIGLAQALHLEVVAEGIELPAQAAELKKLGCRKGQGFLFSRPLRPDTLTAMLLSDSGQQPGSLVLQRQPRLPSTDALAG